MQFDAKTGVLVAEEHVANNSQGISKVRSRSVLKAEQLQISTQYLQHGKWVGGHQALYKEAPTAKVIFQ